MNLLIQCLIAGALGQGFQIIVKLIAIKKRSKAANHEFKAADYFKDDWLSIVAAFFTVLISVFLLDELTKFHPEIVNYVKFFFVATGYAGGSVLNALLGNTEKKILSIIDHKTNIADGKAYENQ
jgi:hypothetical protein